MLLENPRYLTWFCIFIGSCGGLFTSVLTMVLTSISAGGQVGISIVVPFILSLAVFAGSAGSLKKIEKIEKLRLEKYDQ